MAQKLSYEQMENIRTKLISCRSRMDEILNSEVSNEMNQVGKEDVWSGSSAQETQATLDKLKQAFPEFVKALDDCTNYLSTVQESYRAAEEAISGQAGE